MYFDDYRKTPSYDDDPTIPGGSWQRRPADGEAGDGRKTRAAGEESGGYQYRVVNEDPGGWQSARRQNPGRSRRRKRSWGKTVAMVCLCAFLFGGIAGVTYHGTGAVLDAVTLSEDGGAEAIRLSASTGGTVLDARDIAKATLPSIVSVTNQTVQEVRDWSSFFYGYGFGSPSRVQESTSVGSGILIRQTDEALYIVTNYHVVEGATTLTATFADEQTSQAQLVGGDESNDVAVIRVPLSQVPDATLAAVRVAAIGDSDALEVGEPVVAIGNALGYGQSVTAGVVSALDRSLSGEDGGEAATYIQTDAAINPGNSGGALLNSKGEVVGINTAKLSSTEVEGMGYAIPMARAAEIIGGILSQTGSAL